MSHATRRNRLSQRVRAQMALDQDGMCACHELPGWHPLFSGFKPCGKKLSASEGITDEHMWPLEAGGSNDMENRRLFRTPCARIKTDKYDRKSIAKSKRQALETGQQKRRKEKTVKRGPRIESRGFDRRYKKKMNGEVVPR